MSTKVIKRTPDLGIGIKLQPLSAPAPDAPPAQTPCDVTGAYWALTLDSQWQQLEPDPWNAIWPVSVGNYVADVEIGDYLDSGYSYELWRITRCAIRMDRRAGLVGIALGPAAAGVRWTWDWVIPPIPTAEYPEEWHNVGEFGGHDTRQVGSVLLVELYPGVAPNYYLEEAWNATLTALAWCGDTQVAQLVLQVGMSDY